MIVITDISYFKVDRNQIEIIAKSDPLDKVILDCDDGPRAVDSRLAMEWICGQRYKTSRGEIVIGVKDSIREVLGIELSYAQSMRCRVATLEDRRRELLGQLDEAQQRHDHLASTVRRASLSLWSRVVFLFTGQFSGASDGR